MKSYVSYNVERYKYSRAFVFMPEVQALEGVGADSVGAGVVGRTQLGQVAGHGGLAPLRAVHRRRQR